MVPVGDQVVTREATVKAQARQANSCALALEIRSALSPIERPAGDAGAADAGADGGDAAAAEAEDADAGVADGG